LLAFLQQQYPSADAANLQLAALEIIRQVDVRGDGRLSPDEVAWHLGKLESWVRLRRQFALVDTNKDGLISKEEAHSFLQRQYPNADFELLEQMAKECIRLGDVTGDNRLSRQEVSDLIAESGGPIVAS